MYCIRLRDHKWGVGVSEYPLQGFCAFHPLTLYNEHDPLTPSRLVASLPPSFIERVDDAHDFPLKRVFCRRGGGGGGGAHFLENDASVIFLNRPSVRRHRFSSTSKCGVLRDKISISSILSLFWDGRCRFP